MVTLLSLAFASPAPIVVPVQGVISDGAGAPINGVQPAVFRLYQGSTEVHEELQNVVFYGGTFAAQVGVATELSSAAFAGTGPVSMTIEVLGVESEAIAVGWAGRAAWAQRAATADLADDADRLGGELPSTYQKVADAWSPGTGFDLNGRTFDFDTDLLPTTSQIRAAVTGSAINLAAGSTMNGVSLAPLTESTIEGYITNGAINLASGSTMNGVSLAPLSESTVESYITNGAINLAAGSTMNGVSLAPLSEGTVEGFVTNGPLALRASSVTLDTPGKIQFGVVGENSDDMYLRRDNTIFNNSDLRLYIHDDGDGTDRFSIWANSCEGTGGCGTETGAQLKHAFTNAGTVFHGGNVAIGTADIGNARLEVNGDLIRTIARFQSYTAGDGTDSGALIGRNVSYTKRRADTGLRVSWSDNFRVVGNTQACRWEVLFNGVSCTSPGPIVFDKYEGGTSSNRHDPATVFGTCFGLAAGTVNVTTRTTTVPGYGVGDCYTGWNGQLVSFEVEEVR